MNDQPSPGNWTEPRRFALLLGAMVFIPFWKVWLGVQTFGVRDWGLFSFPVAAYLKQSFWRGEWPLWNPYDCCGTPFLAQFNTLALYPGSLIFLLLPPLTWSLPAFCLLHVFWGGMGAYFLARRWTGSQAGAALAGVAFAFNGLSFDFLMWPSHIATFSWMPWVVLLTEDGWRNGGTRLILAVLAAAMQILGGGPETIAFTWCVLLALALVECFRQPRTWWTVAWRLVVMGLLAASLTAAQLLPTLDLALHSHRDTHYGGSAWSMPPLGWANFLVPMFHMTPMQSFVVQPGQYWTSSYYTGLGVVFLAMIAIGRARRDTRVRLLTVILLASVVLALGYNGYVYKWLQQLVPVLGFFRYPVKFVILTLSMAPLLAAYGLAQLEKRTSGEGQGWRLEIAAVASIATLIIVIAWAAYAWPVPNSSARATLFNALWRILFLGLIVLAICLFISRPRWRGCSIVGLLIVCWLDVLTHEPWQNPTLAPSLFQPGLGAMNAHFDPAPSPAESRLMMSPFAARELYYGPEQDVMRNFLLDRSVFMDNLNLLDDFAKVDGFFTLNLRESDKVLRLLDGRTGPKLDNLEDLLSVSQTIAAGKVFDWVPRTNYVPIVSAGQAPVFADDATAFDAIENGTADFRSVVFLPVGAKGTVKASREAHARIVSKNFTPSQQSIEVETPAPTMVVLSEAYYHNWQASLDGQPTTLWRANYAFEAVEVPAGTHRIQLTYVDRAFQVGLAVSFVSIVICGAGWQIARKRRIVGNPEATLSA